MTSALARLRPYQSDALGKLRRAIAGGSLRPLLYAPTGAGKTILAAALIESARLKGKRVAFVVNRVGLVEQTCAAFEAVGIEHGVIQGENTEHVHRPVLVCSIQSLARKGLPMDIDLILIDEAHSVAGSQAYRKLIASRNALPIIGFSATPFSKGLGKSYPETQGPLFDEIVVAATIAELIEDGFLVDCDIYAPSTPDLSGVKIVAGEYQQDQLGEAVDRPALIGDIITHWQALAAGQQTIVFATNIAHSRHIRDSFLAAGVRAEHCDCYTPDDERQETVRRFKAGETTVLCNAGLFAEGFDAPATACMILARPTKSLIRYLQMIGRVLRPFDGKDKALVLDHSGSCVDLGFPTDPMPLELNDGKANVSKSAARERPEQKPKECPKCKFLKSAGVHRCPKCGFVPEKQSGIETGEGTLTKLSRGKGEATRADKQRVYSELLAVKHARGWSDGRTAWAYKDRFGVWPRGLEEVAIEPSQETLNFLQHKQIAYAKSKKPEPLHAT